MGFYVRKSVRAGPFRFNLSKSGVGVSAGVPGFRVGAGPRGNYVHVGRHGVYYRAALGGASPSIAHQPHVGPGSLPAFVPSDVVMEDVTGATPMSLAPTSGDDIVAQLNAASRRTGFGRPAAIAVLALGLVAGRWFWLVWTLGAPVCWWLFLNDRARRTVVLFYDVNDAPAAWFEGLVAAWQWLSNTKKAWRTVASGRVDTTYQHKTNAGASNLVSRVTVAVSLDGPKHLSTNVAVPTLVAGKSSLHFLPDRLLVRDGKSYTDVAYGRLRVSGRAQRFIETPGGLPADAQQVDRTWQYVNVRGGPDRRFKNNPMLPVMLYGALDMTSADGLTWFVQTSRVDAAIAVATAIGPVPLASPP